MTPRLKCALAGVALLVITPLLAKWSIFDVLDKAVRHDGDISYSEKSLFMIPIFALAGPAALIMAAMPSLWLSPRTLARVPWAEQSGTRKMVTIAAVVVFLAAGFALRSWFLGQLSELGYTT